MKQLSSLIFQRLLLFLLVLCLFWGLWQSFLVKKNFLQQQDFSEGIVFVLDVSLSMQVQDMGEISRLQKAKEVILRFLDMSSLPVGFSLFSWEAQKILPFTVDDSLFATILPSLDEKNLSLQGNNIAAALESGISHFSGEIQKGTLILLTDWGEDTIDWLERIRVVLEEKQISLVLVGVGTKKWGPIPLWSNPFGGNVFKRYQWQVVISQLEEETLKSIAEKLGGNYMSLTEFENSFQKTYLWGSSSNWEKISLFVYLSFWIWVFYLSLLLVLKFSYKRLWIF